MTALAHDDETGLHGLGFVNDLFSGMAHDNFSFEVNVLLLGALAERDETALKALTPVFEDRVELRALGGLRRTDYRKDEQLGFQIASHRQGYIQCVLRMRRCVECNQHPLNSNKDRASHGRHLTFFCGNWPLNCGFCLLACV
jgi:hypothetical protein